jgi:hypothetical protein
MTLIKPDSNVMFLTAQINVTLSSHYLQSDWPILHQSSASGRQMDTDVSEASSAICDGRELGRVLCLAQTPAKQMLWRSRSGGHITFELKNRPFPLV